MAECSRSAGVGEAFDGVDEIDAGTAKRAVRHGVGFDRAVRC